MFFEDPQNEEEKLKTLELQNSKTKNSQNPQEQTDKFKQINNYVFEIKWFINIHWENLTRSKSEGVGSNLLGYIGYCL